MSTFKVQPVNIRNGNKAPYFLVDAPNKHEGNLAAIAEFKSRSNLSKSPDWSIDVEKI